VRAVVQRVARARVLVDGTEVAAIGPGLAVLLGVGREDTPDDAAYLADKTANLRIFDDDEGKLNRSVRDTGGEILVVSQFTLYGDARRGRRPSFIQAAPPDQATPLYEAYVAALRAQGLKVATGRFQASMLVEIHNHGPVTILLDSRRPF